MWKKPKGESPSHNGYFTSMWAPSVISPSLSLRLHREALKQSATDPKTGIIDVGILTTGVSSSERMRRQMVAKELKALLQVCTVHDPVV